ncbi:MAG: hypothetical protein E7I45_11055, partial [Eikenella corrodens]|uniref:hypothetical protein n=1 Tax=Eikenella corrodens TaxID=539 RepID=UPI00290EF2EE
MMRPLWLFIWALAVCLILVSGSPMGVGSKTGYLKTIYRFSGSLPFGLHVKQEVHHIAILH